MKVLKLDGGDGYTTLWLYARPLNFIHKMSEMDSMRILP